MNRKEIMKTLIMACVALAWCLTVTAQIHTEQVEYQQDGQVLEGWLAYDEAVQGRQPGVMIVHQWMGLGQFEKKRAEMLARLGYVALAVDIYGKGIRPKNPAEAGAEAGKFKTNRALLRARATAGLEVLKKHARVDARRVAAIGYCFGGTTVLELARSGAGLQGVVSFHGGLDSPEPGAGKNIRCKVLVLHGADDPFVPARDIAAFQEEMRKGGVDWQMVYYANAVHAFTDEGAGGDNSRGAAYNASADRRSWEAMRTFFSEIFSQ
jgi:dienelactone hydrolase